MRSTAHPIQAKRFYAFLRNTYGTYLKRSFRITVLKDNAFKPPYILLANHLNSFDPFCAATFIKHPINYVTSDAFFRNPLLRFLLNKVGSVPKTKFLTDTATAKALINVRKSSGIIGVFPEGARSWDGCTLPLIYSTAKLIKLLRVDVVAAGFAGAMFAMPRWSRFRKKGNTYISYEKVIDSADIADMSVEEIYGRITEALRHDEYEFQREHMNRYTGRRLAERLERFLFFCPACHNFNAMKSKGDMFRCHKCGYEVRYNEYGFFEGGNVIFDDTRKWNLFQHEELKKMTSSDFSVKARNLLLYIGSKEFTRLQRIKIGRMCLSNSSFYFINLKKQKFTFDIDKLSGLNIQSNCKLEFYINDVFYRMNFSKSNMSAYAVKNILIQIKKDPDSEKG